MTRPTGERDRTGPGRVLAAAVLAAALALGGCGDMGRFQSASSAPGSGFVPLKPNKPAAQTPATCAAMLSGVQAASPVGRSPAMRTAISNSRPMRP